jgi:uncharacterized membrane protein YcgQ (UPF0703/DUF1980 family)
MEIPVYLFTGFLESGKTTFIQGVLEDSDFNAGERTLLLVCEEGEKEYNPNRYFVNNVFYEKLESPEDLNREKLAKLQRSHKVSRVIIEYNGMWKLDDLFMNIPEDWTIYQIMAFADASTFLMYNQNMRELVFDKLKAAELVVFNRCRSQGFDKLAFHKICRVANWKSMILYEYGPDEVEADNIEDPLPFDLEKDPVIIGEDAYAEWYRDINEDPEKYDGKTVRLKGMVALGDKLPPGVFVFGRHVMTCCEADIQFAGLLCIYDRSFDLTHREWIDLKAEVKYSYHPIYGEKGPVLYCREYSKTEAPDPALATF